MTMVIVETRMPGEGLVLIGRWDGSKVGVLVRGLERVF